MNRSIGFSFDELVDFFLRFTSCPTPCRGPTCAWRTGRPPDSSIFTQGHRGGPRFGLSSGTTPELGWLAISRCVCVCVANRYDFACVPTDFHARPTKGQALVNVITPGGALEFVAERSRSRRARAGPAAPVLEVVPAQLQGYEESARRWSARRLRRTKNPESQAQA
ncbi:unnamed protein product [Prorocentrum cordatum]|uniref:Uncharacterized protein n=1 Tax=Prorocentrum cordatum TaxID=2364126 RepID=A0ABN9T5A3_9DINO|nr:unnamed protein product [Polarella glacialis]